MDLPPAEVLRSAYLKGKGHGFDGYYRGECGEFERIAYDLGWEDGKFITDPDRLKMDLKDRIIERYRAEHGVYQ